MGLRTEHRTSLSSQLQASAQAAVLGKAPSRPAKTLHAAPPCMASARTTRRVQGRASRCFCRVERSSVEGCDVLRAAKLAPSPFSRTLAFFPLSCWRRRRPKRPTEPATRPNGQKRQCSVRRTHAQDGVGRPGLSSTVAVGCELSANGLAISLLRRGSTPLLQQTLRHEKLCSVGKARGARRKEPCTPPECAVNEQGDGKEEREKTTSRARRLGTGRRARERKTKNTLAPPAPPPPA